MLIGLIADTHGLIRPPALKVFKGANLILHAGDIGEVSVLETLKKIAPVTAVRGNCDRGLWASQIPETQVVEAAGKFIYLLHQRKKIELDPIAAGFQAVICGHSHQPLIEKKPGVIFINPGSAGPRRFKLPVTVGLLRISGQDVEAEIVRIDS